MSANENQIVVYQPNETVRLDVRLENETVWLNRRQMAQLFGRDVKTIGKHIANALSEELAINPVASDYATTQNRQNPAIAKSARVEEPPNPTVAKFATVQREGCRDIVYNETFHDRFLVIDDKELYLIGASLKDLGKKCFAFTKLDSGEIDRIKKTAFGTGTRS